MKITAPLIAFFALCSPVLAAKDGWMDNFDKAKARAKAENKNILLDFTGSDWCGWCKKLDAEVFYQPEWKSYAAKNFVLVVVDSPHTFKLSSVVQKQNEALKTEFKVTGFPTIIILNEGGAFKGKLGYVAGGPKAFIGALEQLK